MYVRTGTTQYNPEDPIEWLNLAHCGFVLPILYIKGSYAAETTTSDGFGSVAIETTGKTHTLTYTEPFNCAYMDNYEDLEASQGAFYAFMILDGHIRKIDVGVSIQVTDPVEEDIKTQLVHNVIVTWEKRTNPKCYGLPGNIFNSCADFERAYNATCPLCPSDVINPGDCPTDPSQLPAILPY